ncbi:MAG: DUF4352 domain-containing protein [Geobacter sp.]|nr:MAG: DUF4352 domain-containing protein [Geobacter sp.]
MALKKCKECGHDISTDAKTCPNCGKKQPSKVGKALLGILGFFFLLGIIGNLVGGKATSSSSLGSSSSGMPQVQKRAEIVQAHLGDTVDVGSFVYRVEDFKFRKTLGNEFINHTADGIYLLIHLSLKNHDKEAHTLDNSLFKLVDSHNVEYESSVNGSTAIEMSGGKTLFLKQCQPNIQTSGVLVFEVPSKEEVYHLKVSGGFWSGKTGEIALVKNKKS